MLNQVEGSSGVRPKGLKHRWSLTKSGIAGAWRAIRPGPETRLGAIAAAVVTLAATVVTGGFLIHSGFGLWIDLLFAALVAAMGIPLVALLFALISTTFRSLPRLLTGFFVGVFLLLASLWMADTTGLVMGALVLFIECALGATLATILLGGLRQAHLSKKILTWSIALLAVSANISLLAFLYGDGIKEEVLQAEKSASQPPPLKASDPSLPGPYAVKTLFYGKGDDLRRLEYGPSVAIRTTTVDATPFFKDFSGWKAFLRRRYWGFGVNRLPLNGRVWYPAGAGPFPLAIMVHGNHTMSDFSNARLCLSWRIACQPRLHFCLG